MRSLKLSLFFILITSSVCLAQVSIPYSQNFDVNATGWTHYALSGTDVWALGTPNKPTFDSSYTSPNGWITGLTSNYPINSVMCLQSPSFDFSDTNNNYYLSFYHKLLLNIGGGVASVEYSTDNGTNWILLNGQTDEKKDWYNAATGFTSNIYSNFKNPNHSLEFLKGQPNVSFRFKLTTYTNSDKGWLMDNFEILPEYENAYTGQGDTIKQVSQYFPNVVATAHINFLNHYDGTFINTVKFYISSNSTLSADDTLSLTYTSNSSGSYTNQTITKIISLPHNLHPGNWYVLYTMNSGDSVPESTYSDNLGYDVLKIDSTYAAPLADNVEGATTTWSTYVFSDYNGSLINEPSLWKRGVSKLVQYEGAVSNSKVWTTGWGLPTSIYHNDYLLSPFINLQNTNNNVICFW
mgnify:CR=1 FL=1